MKIEGEKYRCVDNWFGLVPEPSDDQPINYLEIGAFYGANLISFAESYYGKHKDTKLHCIDPWIDYDEYPEYKGKQDGIYESFLRNIKENIEDTSKVIIHRGFSHGEIPKLPDNHFDIIYIDGNHEPQFIIEDAVLSFRKLKVGGYLIFDDYGWHDASFGIDAFLNSYKKCYRMINPNHNTQVFIQKI
jgi:SAM-dependent methyltransferase